MVLAPLSKGYYYNEKLYRWGVGDLSEDPISIAAKKLWQKLDPVLWNKK